jgi:ribonucleoside-diphosphate reductase alpha chain
MDYIFRWLSKKFIEPMLAAAAEAQPLGVIPPGAEALQADAIRAARAVAAAQAQRELFPAGGNTAGAFVSESDAPACHECGTIMVRSGACHKCTNCGATSGCS